jgi:hypothetical protein
MAKILSDGEVQQVILARLATATDPISLEEIEAAVQWAIELRVSAAILDGILKGDYVIHPRNEAGDWTVGRAKQ